MAPNRRFHGQGRLQVHEHSSEKEPEGSLDEAQRNPGTTGSGAEIPDSMEPVLSEVEGFHPGYGLLVATFFDCAHAERSRASGEVEAQASS